MDFLYSCTIWPPPPAGMSENEWRITTVFSDHLLDFSVDQVEFLRDYFRDIDKGFHLKINDVLNISDELLLLKIKEDSSRYNPDSIFYDIKVALWRKYHGLLARELEFPDIYRQLQDEFGTIDCYQKMVELGYQELLSEVHYDRYYERYISHEGLIDHYIQQLDKGNNDDTYLDYLITEAILFGSEIRRHRSFDRIIEYFDMLHESPDSTTLSDLEPRFYYLLATELNIPKERMWPILKFFLSYWKGASNVFMIAMWGLRLYGDVMRAELKKYKDTIPGGLPLLEKLAAL